MDVVLPTDSVVIAHSSNRKLVQGWRKIATGIRERGCQQREQGEPSPRVKSIWRARRTASGQRGWSGESKG